MNPVDEPLTFPCIVNFSLSVFVPIPIFDTLASVKNNFESASPSILTSKFCAASLIVISLTVS